MYFDEIIGLNDAKGKEIITRQAVRAISIKKDKILMVKSNKGDFKLPGGGIEKGESHQQAIAREIKEETGYICINIDRMVGRIVERRDDRYEKDKVFEMTSHYYICQVSDEIGKQALDEYEIDFNFIPIWISIDDAIKRNLEFLNNLDVEDLWTERENFVLKRIRKSLINRDFIKTLNG